METIALVLGSGFMACLADRAYEPLVPGDDRRGDLLAVLLGRHRVPVLLRHGMDHRIPPHRIDHRAHLDRLRDHGVRAIVSLSSAGALVPGLEVGELLAPDDLFAAQDDGWTCFDDRVRHTAMDRPFDDPWVQAFARADGRALRRGTYVGVRGPRYPSRAELRFYAQVGEVVGMTVVPEAILAAECGLPYASVCVITDAAHEVAPRHEAVVRAAAPARARCLRAFERMLGDRG